VTDPTIYQLNRYGVANPLSLLWELTTLSFVVDWFTGIGDFLDSLTASFGLSYLWGYETRYVRGQFTVLHDMLTPPQYPISGDRYARCPVTLTSMRRYANPGFLPPPIYFRVDLNLNRVLSSIALLTTAIRR